MEPINMQIEIPTFMGKWYLLGQTRVIKIPSDRIVFNLPRKTHAFETDKQIEH